MESLSVRAPIRSLPGPRPFPLLGWLPLLIQLSVRPLATLEGLQRKYGNLIQIGLGKSPAYMIFDPVFNQQVLRDPSVFYSFDQDISPLPIPRDSAMSRLNSGLPFINGERHNMHRTEMLPYFHRKFITRYQAASVEVTEKKVGRWKAGQEVKMRGEMEQLAMWLATAPVLGMDAEQDGDRMGRELEKMVKALFSPPALTFPYDLPGTPFRRLRKTAEEMEAVVREFIAQRKREGLEGDDLLSMMIKLHEQEPEKFSENELLANTMTMFRGGYNPSGMALYWSIFLLSRHPQAMQRVQAELEAALGGRSPEVEQLEKLPFLEGVIKETMRLFPAGTWTGRYSTQPFEMDGHHLPGHTWIILSPYVTHRLPEVFPEPRKFMPERWLSIHPSSYEFLPFSAGPRYCIGAALAMMQLKTALAIILQNYHFQLKPGAKVDCAGINSIRPKNGLPMIAHARGESPPMSRLSGNVKEIMEVD